MDLAGVDTREDTMTTKITIAARILARLTATHAEKTDVLANALGVSRSTVVSNARKLADAGFVFAEDDFEGRRRSGGRYAHALWVCDYEPTPLDEQTAATLIADAKRLDVCGRDLACTRGLGC